MLNFNDRICPVSVASTLDTNKYKLLMKIAVEDLDIIKGKSFYKFHGKKFQSRNIQ